MNDRRGRQRAGSSSYDWPHAFARLDGQRLTTFDFLGFGLSDKPRDHLYSLLTQADLERFVEN